MNDAGNSLRNALRAEREALFAEFYRNGRVAPLLRALARTVDRLLRRVVVDANLKDRILLVAVGGYGRGELFPYSDVDVLIIPCQALTSADEQAVETLVGLLWDLGLHLGHSVRTLDECEQEASRDVTVLTSMLEARPISGPRPLYREFCRRIHACFDPQAFFRAKMLEQQQRHTKFQDSPYSLEPNCKESPGGLRDLQVLLWVARAAGLGGSWRELEQRGILTADERRLIQRNERVLKEIRARVHLAAGRREDRLVFDVQHQVALSAGFEATASRRASEMLMQRYYLAAKGITQLNTIVLQNIEVALFPRSDEAATPIDETFVARNEVLDLASDDGLRRDPNGLLRAFLILAQYRELKGMSARLLRALWHERDRIDARFRRDPRNRATFLAILQQPVGVTHNLRRMNQWSILGRYLPVFRRIVGQMQHDLFHVYTVDMHILMVLRNLRRFALAQFAHEYPMCSQLMADFERPWVLLIAALFHDIAKGRGGDHSELGMADARAFCRAHDIGKEDTDLICFLVEHHLTMSQIAQKQDIADPAVVSRFAKLVASERRLVALYLLTVADIRGTSPKVWNAWKGRLLEDLFRQTRRLLGGEAVPATAELDRRKREALRLLSLYGVYVKDQRELFARVCGYFDSAGLSILDAKIHTTRHGYALDTFLVTDQGRAAHFRSLLAQIEKDLSQWITAAGALPEPVKGRLSRQSRHFPISPMVHLAPDERGSAHLLTITATDRIGLLYATTHILAHHGINIHTAKINTLGERVEDVFLIDGAALETARGQLQLEQDLLEALAT